MTSGCQQDCLKPKTLSLCYVSYRGYEYKGDENIIGRSSDPSVCLKSMGYYEKNDNSSIACSM